METPKPSPSPFDAHDIRRISVEALVDEKTVRRMLSGQSVKPLTRRRVEKALEALGLDPNSKKPRGAMGAPGAPATDGGSR